MNGKIDRTAQTRNAMRTDFDGKRIHTTIGDLVVAVTDVALDVEKDKKKAYRIASRVVNSMLKSPTPSDLSCQLSMRVRFSEKVWLH
jgi:hypothetical protein